MAAIDEVVIISGCRTPVGKFQGALSDLSATQLGAIVVREAVKLSGVEPARVDECIMGNVISAGLGQNPARQAAIYGGLPPEVSAMPSLWRAELKPEHFPPLEEDISCDVVVVGSGIAGV